jgi:NADH-quinone oxidoreductase subunit M
MNGFPWLSVLGGIPLLGAIVLVLLPSMPPDSAPADVEARNRLAKILATAFSVITLIWFIVMATRFNTSGPTYQFMEQYSWIPQFGVHYALGVDGIALVLIGMTVVLQPLVILASWNDADKSGKPVKQYLALMMVLETMTIGVFAATDVFLFYVFFEAMLIPMYFMIGSFGVGPRQYAAVKFLLYSLLGGLLMLAAIIALFVYSEQSAATGHHGTFLLTSLLKVSLSPGTQKWLFLGFFIAFAIKAPLWPFHTWLPDATASAQPGAAVLMLGVMDKVGTFGMLRYCLELFPAGAHYFTDVILVLAVISVLYGAIVAIGQKSLKRLIGYTSISHFGFIVLGIFAMTSQGQAGATLYMVNHGFATGALFLLGGFLIARRGLSTFVSEFLVLVGTFDRYKVAASFATAGIILASIYILWMYQRTMNGPTPEPVAAQLAGKDLRPRELLAVVPLVALIIAMGVYPKPVLDVINPAVRATMSQIHATDPVPAHPASQNNTAAVQNGVQP